MAGLELTVDWGEIAMRLGAATVAGILMGMNREGRGKPAGLRTVLLVCLAATFAMLLGNMLIGTRGKTADSFVQLDMMRLPLGVLAGIGFIGAGTIVRKGDLVVGVTTAATIWYVTMVGFCFGAGQMALGWVATGLGVGALWGLTWVEQQFRQEHHAILEVTTEGSDPPRGIISEEEVRSFVEGFGYQVISFGMEDERLEEGKRRRRYSVEVHWHARRRETQGPRFLQEIAARAGVVKVGWKAG